MQMGLAYIKEHLDRGLCNHRFLYNFPDTMVIHLPRTRSDHHPILVCAGMSQTLMNNERPFHLLTGWFTHPKFEMLVKEAWSATSFVMEIMKGFWSSVRT